jgi:adenylosuccinate lyase
MQRNTTHSDDLQDRLLFLKSLMEEIFSDITDQIEDLRVENRELKRNAQDERQLIEAEAKAIRRIDLLEMERAELQATISQMSNAIEEGRQVQQQLLRKAQDLERLDRMVEGLEAERASNFATIQKLKAKIDELASDKREANNRIQSQDNFLEEIKK